MGQRVRLLGRGGPVVGVVGKKAIHIMDKDDREKVSKVEDLWIDIGAANRAEAERAVRIGDPGVLAAGVLEFPNGRLVSRCIDNRIGAFVVLEALRLLAAAAAAPRASVTAVATTREEIAATGGGARSSAVALEPDVAIVVDVTHATDYPGIEKRRHGDYRLGGGPVLSRGASVSEIVFELLAEAAEAEEIPYTIEAASRDTHTDAEAIFNAHRGRGHGAGLGSEPLHAQPQRDGGAGGPRPDRAAAGGVRPATDPRHRLRAALSGVFSGMIRTRLALLLAGLRAGARPGRAAGPIRHPAAAPGREAGAPADHCPGRHPVPERRRARRPDDRLPGADTAAAYLARRFEQVGLQPAAGGWFQSFTVAREAPVAQSAQVGGLAGKNVIGLLPGHDPVLRNETVIVGAHYDHLGLGGFGSLDPDSTGQVHNGADDNASGAAMLIQIAARLAQSPPARTVVFIAFSGEELGLLGSAHYVKQPIYPLATTLAMINLDMVGRLRNGRLIVYGARTAKEFPALLDSLNWHAGFDLKAQGDGYGPSDQSSFYAAGRPVLHFFTDLHEDYHRTTDDWQKIDPEGFRRVAELHHRAGDRAGQPPHASSRRWTPRRRRTPPAGGGAGVRRLSRHRARHDRQSRRRATRSACGPAARRRRRGSAGTTSSPGSASIEMPDLQAMTDALRSHEPGRHGQTS